MQFLFNTFRLFTHVFFFIYFSLTGDIIIMNKPSDNFKSLWRMTSAGHYGGNYSDIVLSLSTHWQSLPGRGLQGYQVRTSPVYLCFCWYEYKATDIILWKTGFPKTQFTTTKKLECRTFVRTNSYFLVRYQNVDVMNLHNGYKCVFLLC